MWLNTACFYNSLIQFLIKGPIFSHFNKPTCTPSGHELLKQLGITCGHIAISAKKTQGYMMKNFADFNKT